jgi:hypothetical protein
MERNASFVMGAQWGFKECITFLHREAQRMNDPHAVQVIHLMASELGNLKHRTFTAPKSTKAPVDLRELVKAYKSTPDSETRRPKDDDSA